MSSPQVAVPQVVGLKELECFDSWNIVLVHESSVNSNFNNVTFSSATFTQLRNGFGLPSICEYFVGAQPFFHLVNKVNYIVRVDMWLQDGTFHFAEFKGVVALSAFFNYALSLQSYYKGSATAGGMVTHHNSSVLTATDNDAGLELNCVDEFGGGWWYINGRTVPTENGEEHMCFVTHLTSQDSMVWAQESSDGRIVGSFDLDKVVVRMMGDPDFTQSKWLLFIVFLIHLLKT